MPRTLSLSDLNTKSYKTKLLSGWCCFCPGGRLWCDCCWCFGKEEWWEQVRGSPCSGLLGRLVIVWWRSWEQALLVDLVGVEQELILHLNLIWKQVINYISWNTFHRLWTSASSSSWRRVWKGLWLLVFLGMRLYSPSAQDRLPALSIVFFSLQLRYQCSLGRPICFGAPERAWFSLLLAYPRSSRRPRGTSGGLSSARCYTRHQLAQRSHHGQ